MSHHPKDIISCEKNGKKVWIYRKDQYVYSGKGYVINEDDIKEAGVDPAAPVLPTEGPDVSEPLPDGILEDPEVPGLEESP